MKTSVSIVTHRTSAELLGKALESLSHSAVDHVIIVDNSPEHPAAPPRPENATYTLEYIEAENRGYGAAHNIAIRRAHALGATYHLVMNPDVRWSGDAIGPLTQYLDLHPQVALCMPRLVYPDGVLQYSARMVPTPFDLIIKRFLPPRLTQRRMRRYLLADIDHSRPFDCPYILGSFMLFRMAPLIEIDGFDERFFMYPEDIDISRRLHSRWRTLYLPITTVIHDHAAASRTSSRMLRIHITNMIKYFCKWGWFYDPERRRFNRRLLSTAPRIQGTPPPGRG